MIQATNLDIPASKAALIKAVENRVEAQFVFELADWAGLKKEALAQWLEISLKTLKRYQQENKKLNAKESELVLKLYSLFARGGDVFGDFAEFRQWLSEPSFGLNNQVPDTLLFTSEGINLVHDELDRIAYGDLA
jgi:putative toxin-antitoxin system antitoxin component (TIGR02293 family)